MGSEVSCCRAPTLTTQKLGPDPGDDDQFVCTDWSHVKSLLANLPPSVESILTDKAFHSKCQATFQQIVKSRRADDASKDPGFLEGHELIEAVHLSIPDSFLQKRLHANDLSKLIGAFDADNDGRISQPEFDLFCMWAVAMDVMGFFAGTTPFGTIANEASADHLLIISEFLDPEHILGRCALPTTACAYYHPDGITLSEFSAQISSAAHVRTKQGKFFKSVALANHGPNEEGFWNVCSDQAVNLKSVDSAWPRLMPVFQALADMVASPTHMGNVDLLACNFAANQTGLDCPEMIEKSVNAKFSASTDGTGNVASGGNWELERGGRNVAPIYFEEHKLEEFTKLMAPGKSHRSKNNGQESETVALANHGRGEESMGGTRSLMCAQEKALGAAGRHYVDDAAAQDPYAAAHLKKKKHNYEDKEAASHINEQIMAAACSEEAVKRRGGSGAKAKAKYVPPRVARDTNNTTSDFV